MEHEPHTPARKDTSFDRGVASCVISVEVERYLAGCARDSSLARRATLAKLLPRLNAKLEDELEGLISLQKSIQEEDKANAKERAIGRAFNSERRRFERQLIILNLELLKLKPMPEGLSEAEREQHEIYQAETMEKLSYALDNLRRRGKLVEAEPPYPKRRVVPRRNLRREELERRASLIRELTAFCEVVEGVVAGERIVDDETMADLITRARAYLSSEESAIEQTTSESEPKSADTEGAFAQAGDTAGATPRRGGDTAGATPRRGGELETKPEGLKSKPVGLEYSTTEDWQYTQRLIDKRTPYKETLSSRAEKTERERIEDEAEDRDNPEATEGSKNPTSKDTEGATPRRGGDTEGATPRRGGDTEGATPRRGGEPSSIFVDGGYIPNPKLYPP